MTTSIPPQLMRIMRDTHADVREYILGLRITPSPAYLEQFGLEPALGTLCEQTGAMPGAPACSFRVEGVPRRLRSEVEVALLRIAQEVMNNARQHADASRVDVSLNYGAESVAVVVADDGRGFNAPASPGGLTASGHYGLAGVRERALLVGGRLEIDIAPGRGTRLEVSVPSAILELPAPGTSAKA